jgi:2Fe-2S ferredoxin
LNDDEVPVRLEPLGLTVPVRRGGETLMHAARRAGLRWPTVCHGSGICSVCYVRITATTEPLPEPGYQERLTLERVPSHMQGANTRLACQILVTAPMTVERAGIGPPAEPQATG